MGEYGGLLTDGYLFYFLRFLLSKPSIQKQFHRLYITDRYRFYSAARQRSLYDNEFIASDLEGQISFREDLGIILVASTDEDVFRPVYNILIDAHPRMKELLCHPDDQETFDFLMGDIGNELSSGGSSFLLFPLTYLLYRGKYDDAKTDRLYIIVSSLSAEMENSFRAIELNKHQGISDKDLAVEKNEYGFSQEDWKIIRKLRYPVFVDQLAGLSADRNDVSQDVLSGQRAKDAVPAAPSVLRALSSYSDEKEKELLIAMASSVCYLLARSNVFWKDIAGERALTKEDQAHILRSCWEWRDESDSFRPHDFLIATVVYCLGKEIVNMKKMYWANNAETVLMEIEKAKQQVKELSSAVDSLAQEKKTLLSEKRQLEDRVRMLERNADADYRDVIKPYADKVSALERENTKLRAQSANADAVLEELESLRSLVFGDEPDADAAVLPSLREMLADRRIVIVGGHINLRSKLMERYSDLTVIDGVSPAFDLQSLDNADLVVFYVYHMSHKVYQKAITYLRQRKKPFAYLPRITNMEMLDVNLQKIIYEKLKL